MTTHHSLIGGERLSGPPPGAMTPFEFLESWPFDSLVHKREGQRKCWQGGSVDSEQLSYSKDSECGRRRGLRAERWVFFL